MPRPRRSDIIGSGGLRRICAGFVYGVTRYVSDMASELRVLAPFF
jgi:hypothetical protein